MLDTEIPSSKGYRCDAKVTRVIESVTQSQAPVCDHPRDSRFRTACSETRHLASCTAKVWANADQAYSILLEKKTPAAVSPSQRRASVCRFYSFYSTVSKQIITINKF